MIQREVLTDTKRGLPVAEGTLSVASSNRLRTMAKTNRDCRCGHPSAAHEHYRIGTSCGFCGCSRFHRKLPRWLSVLNGMARRGNRTP